jgi:hypothetical protein
MSCKECSRQINNIIYRGNISFYRWKKANIAIIGCKRHVKEIIEQLNKMVER